MRQCSAVPFQQFAVYKIQVSFEHAINRQIFCVQVVVLTKLSRVIPHSSFTSSMAINDKILNSSFKEVSNCQLNHLQYPPPIFIYFGNSLNIGINSMNGQETRHLGRQFRHNPHLMHSLEVEKPHPGTLYIKVML